MTISTTAPRVSFNCDGATKVFPIPVQAYLATDFEVILTAPTGVGGTQTILVLNSDYSLATSGTLQPPAWTLTTLGAAAYAAGYTLQAFINPPQSQQSQYVAGQAFPSLAIQTNLDRLTQMVQRLQDEISRSVRAQDGDPSPGMLLPLPQVRASNYAAFDANGNIVAVPSLPTGSLTPAGIGAVIFPRTTAENNAAVVPTNINIPSHDQVGVILLQRYGGGETATAAANNAAFTQAVLVAGQCDGVIGITNDGGTWNFSAGWVLSGSGQAMFGGGAPVPGAGTQGCRVQGFGRPYVLFTGLGAGVDCVTIGGSQMPQISIKDIQLDCGTTGRDGLVILASNAPVLDNVLIRNTVRDGLVLSPSANLFIEKPKFKDIFLGSVGRHGINISLSGPGGYLAYVNEGTWEHIELRKCAVITAGGTFCNMTAQAGGNASSVKIANHTWIDCNLDCAYAGAGPVPGVSPFTTDSAVVQNFSIIGGGWESTGGVTPGGAGYGCNVTGTGSWGGLIVLGVLTNSFWGPGVAGLPFNPVILALNDFSFSFGRNWMQKIAALFNQPMQVEDLFTWENKNVFGGGSNLKKLHQKTTAPGAQTDGIPADGTLHSSVAGATSATVHLQFPLALVSPAPISDFVHSFLLLISNSSFANFNGNITEMYWIQVAPNLATCLATSIKSASSGGQITGVVASIVATTTLDLAITLGATFGTGGANTTIYGTLMRGAFVL